MTQRDSDFALSPFCQDVVSLESINAGVQEAVLTYNMKEMSDNGQLIMFDRVNIGQIVKSSVQIDGIQGNLVIKPITDVPDSSVVIQGPSENTVRISNFGVQDETLDKEDRSFSSVKVGDLSESTLDLNKCEGNIVQIGDVHGSSVHIGQCDGNIVQIGSLHNSSVHLYMTEGTKGSCIQHTTHVGESSADNQVSTDQLYRATLSMQIEESSQESEMDAQPSFCRECTEVTHKYAKHAGCHAFHIHMADFRRKASERARRRKTSQTIEKIVCALRNTTGGVVLIHLSDQSPGDRYLGHFDELISGIFPTVAEYGEMATNAYKRMWLSDHSKFESCQNFVLLHVTQSPWLVTVDFNTRIRNDYETAKPTHLSILSHLSRRDRNVSDTFPLIRGMPSNMQFLQESRNIELKAFNPKMSDLGAIENDATILAKYIWSNLKLKHSVTAMSKVDGGGSYYVGISEKRVKHNTYESTVPEAVGFRVKVSADVWIKELDKLIKANLSVLHRDGNITSAPDDLFSLKLHWLNSENYVLEVAIRYFDGIVFSDRHGPRSYRVKNGKIVRLTFEEWMWKIHVTQRHFKP